MVDVVEEVFQESLLLELHIPLPTCLALAMEKILVEKPSSLVVAVAVFGLNSYLL
jgi:hypothetical protein